MWTLRQVFLLSLSSPKSVLAEQYESEAGKVIRLSFNGILKPLWRVIIRFLHPKLTPILTKELVQGSVAVHWVIILGCLNDKQLLGIFPFTLQPHFLLAANGKAAIIWICDLKPGPLFSLYVCSLLFCYWHLKSLHTKVTFKEYEMSLRAT